jgi:hypothetical protein
MYSSFQRGSQVIARTNIYAKEKAANFISRLFRRDYSEVLVERVRVIT